MSYESAITYTSITQLAGIGQACITSNEHTPKRRERSLDESKE
jgi:hypothetical protein